jgi:Domain of unknown function (DUF4349)
MDLSRFLQPKQIGLALVSGLVITSCAIAQTPKPQSLSEAAAPPMAGAPASSPSAKAVADRAMEDAPARSVATSPTAPKPISQLIKTANLELRVDQIEKAIAQIKTIVQSQQGDMLSLNSSAGDNRPVATLQLRVPQTQLDAALQAIKGLGTVKQQSIAAEDVSNQIVDTQARLRNLKRTENNLLEIMDRSGSIADVLKVSQELSNTRNSIEQLTAQVADLQNRVAYSVINLKLEAAIASQPSDRTVPVQLHETWDGSTRSLSQVTLKLVKLGVWILVYSPYLGILLLAVWIVRRRRISNRAAR